MEIIFIILSLIFMIIAFLLIKFSRPMSKEEAKISRVGWKKEGGWSPPPKFLSDKTFYKSYVIGAIILFIIGLFILILGLYLILY